MRIATPAAAVVENHLPQKLATASGQSQFAEKLVRFYVYRILSVPEPANKLSFAEDVAFHRLLELRFGSFGLEVGHFIQRV